MKTIVWTQPSRIFHWYIATGFVLAYSLSDYIQVHAAIGLSVGVILLFRIIWGVMGPRYSRFTDFPISLRRIKALVLNPKEEERKYTGHNPLAALVMLLLIADGIAVAITGLVTALSDDSAFFGTALFSNYEGHKETHELLVNLLIVLAIAHLWGLGASLLHNREMEVSKSMFTGFKRMHGINANLTLRQKIIALAAALTTIATLTVVLIQ